MPDSPVPKKDTPETLIGVAYLFARHAEKAAREAYEATGDVRFLRLFGTLSDATDEAMWLWEEVAPPEAREVTVGSC